MRCVKGVAPLVLSLASILLFAASCSFTRSGAACSSTQECRTAFGPGQVCAESGLCESAATEPTCQSQLPADLLLEPEKYRNYVVLGSLLRATGKENARQDAVELVINTVNRFLAESEEAYPSLGGLRFGLVQCDHDGDTEKVARLAGYLTDTLLVPAILGPASSSTAVAAFSAVGLNGQGEETRQVLFVSPSATSVALKDLESESPGLLWRTAPTDDAQGRLMGAYAVQRGEPFVAFYEDTAYGRGLYEELKMSTGTLCEDCGIAFDASSPDVVPLTRALASNRAVQALQESDLVLFMGAQESHIREMLRRLDEPEFAGKTLFFSDAAASSDTVNSVSTGSIDRVIGTRVRPPENSEALRFFASAYEGLHEESPLIHSFTANAYDAAWLVVVATLRARLSEEGISPETIARGFTKISAPKWQNHDQESCPVELQDGVCPPLALDVGELDAILQAFEQLDEIDVQGASGPLDYCAVDEELERRTDAFQLWGLETAGDQEVRIVGLDTEIPASEPLPPCPIEAL